MLPLLPGARPGTPLAVLCLGAHADDIEIGAGGTLLRLLREYPGSRVHWVVLAAHAEREREARASATAFLADAGRVDMQALGFRDGFFPSQFAAIKETFEGLKDVRPDVVLTHCRSDHHQDHRFVAELSWNTFRNHLVLEYEIPKFDPDLGNPNLFVPIDQEDARFKVEALMTHFGSQRSRDWFTRETFLGLMRVRGVQAASPTGLAEAFYAPKLRLLD